VANPEHHRLGAPDRAQPPEGDLMIEYSAPRNRHYGHAALAGIGLADPEVILTPVDHLDRQHSGKLKRFIPLVPDRHPDHPAGAE
jgi:hypothetical protein